MLPATSLVGAAVYALLSLASSDATDRLDSGGELRPEEREELLERIRGLEQAAQQRVEDLRTQSARAEKFAATLAARLAGALTA